MAATGVVSVQPQRETGPEYRSFPNESGRNWRQENVESPLMVHLLRLPRRVAVLEVGCGRGVALPVLWRLLRPTRLVGADIDPLLLKEADEHARQQGVPVELEHADIRALPFAAGSFDLCIDFGTLYHIGRSEQALREITRVLRPGGRLVTETRLSQLLSHPIRSLGRRIPWPVASDLVTDRHAVLWQSHQRSS